MPVHTVITIIQFIFDYFKEISENNIKEYNFIRTSYNKTSGGKNLICFPKYIRRNERIDKNV